MNEQRLSRGSARSGRRLTVTVVALAMAMVGVLVPTMTAHAAVEYSDYVENITPAGDADSGNYERINISDDGNMILFSSLAANLTADAANGERNVFLHDRAADTIVNVTAAATNQIEDAVLSGDGNTVVFSTRSVMTADPDAGNDIDIFLYDVATAAMTRITPETVSGNSGSTLAANIDATVIGFVGDANLAGTPSGYNKAFLWENGTFTKLSEGVNHNSYGVTISGDTSMIAFNAFFFGEMQWYLWDAASSQPVYQSPGGRLVLSHDASFGAISILTNAGRRLAVMDNTGAGTSWSYPSTATVSTYEISADGTQIIAATESNGIRRVYRIDTATLTSTLVVPGTHDPVGGVDLNEDGSIAVFAAGSSTLTGDPDNGFDDIFVMTEIAPATCQGHTVTVNMNYGQTPTGGDDVILGTPGDDIINAGPGDDIVCAGDGADTVRAGSGQDMVWGGTGDDRLYGAGGQDTLRGEDGADRLYGGAAIDLIFGDAGDDYLYGHAGLDDLRGGDGDDFIVGGADDDVVFGHDGNDTLQGGDGDDTVSGGAGDDAVRGGNGDDALMGDGGTDVCAGQDGTDTADTTCETVTSVP